MTKEQKLDGIARVTRRATRLARGVIMLAYRSGAWPIA
jgi:hypothetical protein